MDDFQKRLETALSGPDAESSFECAHCGSGHKNWQADCQWCGGVVMRIVTDSRDDDTSIDG